MEYVRTFLNMFIRDEDETFIDIKLALESLPKKIDAFNVSRCEQYQYSNTFNALISFQNQEPDKLFEYYDNRNKKRLNQLLIKSTENKRLT